MSIERYIVFLCFTFSILCCFVVVSWFHFREGRAVTVRRHCGRERKLHPLFLWLAETHFIVHFFFSIFHCSRCPSVQLDIKQKKQRVDFANSRDTCFPTLKKTMKLLLHFFFYISAFTTTHCKLKTRFVSLLGDARKKKNPALLFPPQ